MPRTSEALEASSHDTSVSAQPPPPVSQEYQYVFVCSRRAEQGGAKDGGGATLSENEKRGGREALSAFIIVTSQTKIALLQNMSFDGVGDLTANVPHHTAPSPRLSPPPVHPLPPSPAPLLSANSTLTGSR